MKCITLSFLVLVCLVFGNTAQAQKFGHVNSAQLVESHPKVATANADLEIFRKTLTDPFEAKARAFQSKYQFFMEEMQAGTLSKVSAQTRQGELQKEQEDLGKEEQQIQFAILQKREQLLQPILAELDSLIQLVGKEGKYTMIFDSSLSGVVLVSPEGDNLTENIRARIKEE